MRLPSRLISIARRAVVSDKYGIFSLSRNFRPFLRISLYLAWCAFIPRQSMTRRFPRISEISECKPVMIRLRYYLRRYCWRSQAEESFQYKLKFTRSSPLFCCSISQSCPALWSRYNAYRALILASPSLRRAPAREFYFYFRLRSFFKTWRAWWYW